MKPFLLTSLLLLSSSSHAGTLKVLAAASLMEAFEAIAAEYERAHPGEDVDLAFAGSQVLQTQIEQGAPADVFASADQVPMDALKERGLVADSAVFARNRLVLAAPKGGKVSSLQDAALPGVKVVIAGESVPAGRYTAQVLQALDGLYGKGYLEKVRANTVSRESSVRGVLVKVVLGEADAGFVYATDASSVLDKVRAIPIPEKANAIAAYPIAVLSASALPDQSRAFVDLVLGEKGQAFLKERGFLPAR